MYLTCCSTSARALTSFFEDRIRYYFRDIRGYPYDEVNAAMAGGWLLNFLSVPYLFTKYWPYHDGVNIADRYTFCFSASILKASGLDKYFFAWSPSCSLSRASMERMAELSSGGGPAEFLSTHPSHGTRIEQLKAWMPEAMAIYQKRTPAPNGLLPPVGNQ